MTENTPTVREALEPFAKAATGAGTMYRDDAKVAHLLHVSSVLTLGDLRRARAAFEALPAPFGESVTVPRVPTEAMREAAMAVLMDGSDIYDNGDQIVVETFAPKRVYRAMIEAAPVLAPTADEGGAEDRAEQFIQAAVDRAPEPLKRLGEWLAKKLDEDDWKTVERMLLGAALADRAEINRGTAEAGKAVAWQYRYKTSAGFSRWEVTASEAHARSMAVDGGEYRPLYTAIPPALAQLQADNERLTRERDAQNKRADNHWETLRSIREMAQQGDCDRIILWVTDAGSGYTESAGETMAQLTDRAIAAEARATDLQERLEKVEAAAKAFFEASDAEPDKDCWDTETGEEEEGASRFASDWSWNAYYKQVQESRDVLRAAVTGDAQEAVK